MEEKEVLDLSGRHLFIANKGITVPLLSKNGQLLIKVDIYHSYGIPRKRVIIPETLERYMLQVIYGDHHFGWYAIDAFLKSPNSYVVRNYLSGLTEVEINEFVAEFKRMHEKQHVLLDSYKKHKLITACQPNENGLVEIAMKPMYLKQRFWMTLEEQDEILRIAINEGRDATYNWLSDKVKEKGLCDYKFEETIVELRIYFQKQYGFFSMEERNLLFEETDEPQRWWDAQKSTFKKFFFKGGWKVGAKDTGMELGGLLVAVLVFMIPLSIGISMIYGALWIVENTKPGVFGLVMIPVLLLGGLAVLGYLGEAIKRLGK